MAEELCNYHGIYSCSIMQDFYGPITGLVSASTSFSFGCAQFHSIFALHRRHVTACVLCSVPTSYTTMIVQYWTILRHTYQQTDLHTPTEIRFYEWTWPHLKPMTTFIFHHPLWETQQAIIKPSYTICKRMVSMDVYLCVVKTDCKYHATNSTYVHIIQRRNVSSQIWTESEYKFWDGKMRG